MFEPLLAEINENSQSRVLMEQKVKLIQWKFNKFAKK